MYVYSNTREFILIIICNKTNSNVCFMQDIINVFGYTILQIGEQRIFV